MLLRELWNEGEVGIPPLQKLELFTGLNAISIQLIVNFRQRFGLPEMQKPRLATESFPNLSINFKDAYCTQHIVHMHLTDSHAHTHPSTHHAHTHTPRRQLEPVRLTLAQRTGNKEVTLVDNLDGYLIPPAEIARRIAFVSTTGDQ